MATQQCCVCDEWFDLEPHNRHHQRYCLKASCQAERNRRKRRRHYQRNHNDQQFRRQEAERQRQHRLNIKKMATDKLDAAAAASPPAMPASPPTVPAGVDDFILGDLVIGMISQIAACASSSELHCFCMRLVEEGRRFQVGGLLSRQPPAGMAEHPPVPPQ